LADCHNLIQAMAHWGGGASDAASISYPDPMQINSFPTKMFG
jgi:hypothetical protein